LHPRGFCLRLRARSLDLRAVSRAGSPARIPVGRLDHGHASVAPVDACRHRAHGSSFAQAGGAPDMMDTATLEMEIRRRIAVGGPMPLATDMEFCLAGP